MWKVVIWFNLVLVTEQAEQSIPQNGEEFRSQ